MKKIWKVKEPRAAEKDEAGKRPKMQKGTLESARAQQAALMLEDAKMNAARAVNPQQQDHKKRQPRNTKERPLMNYQRGGHVKIKEPAKLHSSSSMELTKWPSPPQSSDQVILVSRPRKDQPISHAPPQPTISKPARAELIQPKPIPPHVAKPEVIVPADMNVISEDEEEIIRTWVLAMRISDTRQQLGSSLGESARDYATQKAFLTARRFL